MNVLSKVVEELEQQSSPVLFHDKSFTDGGQGPGHRCLASIWPQAGWEPCIQDDG